MYLFNTKIINILTNIVKHFEDKIMEKLSKISFFKYVVSLFIVYILFCMILSPSFYLQTTLDGISAWALNVLPSLLPFVFFTKLLSSFGLIEKLSSFFAKPIKKLFNAPALSAYTFLSSIISGYPVGAKVTADLYQSGKISRTDACKMLSFSSTSGPMFVIGAVGAGMFGNALAGYIIFSTHVLGAFLNGLLYRKIKLKEFDTKATKKEEKSFNLSSIVLDTSLSVITVGTIIAIFFVVISSLSPLLSFLPSPVSAFCGGLIEITRGCLDIANAMPLSLGIISASFIISFGGISTMMQTYALTSEIKMPIKLMVLQKLTHALLSCLISIILVAIIL